MAEWSAAAIEANGSAGSRKLLPSGLRLIWSSTPFGRILRILPMPVRCRTAFATDLH